MRGCCILLKAFSASYDMIRWFIFFQFVYMVDYIDRFSYVEPSLHLWDEADMFMVDDGFDVVLDSILFSIFVSIFMSEIGL